MVLSSPLGLNHDTLSEGVASLRLGSERVSTSRLHKTKIKPSSCLFVFLSLHYFHEEYLIINLKSYTSGGM